MMRNSKFKIQNSKLGFTLIELLVVISIIGILASLLLARFGSVEKAARDTQRKSDLNQYRTALENFAIKTGGLYPSYIIDTEAQSLCDNFLRPDYLGSCPRDPLQEGDPLFGDGPYYHYQSNGTVSGQIQATQYILWAELESRDYNWYVCANGKIAEQATPPAPANCGF